MKDMIGLIIVVLEGDLYYSPGFYVIVGTKAAGSFGFECYIVDRPSWRNGIPGKTISKDISKTRIIL